MGRSVPVTNAANAGAAAAEPAAKIALCCATEMAGTGTVNSGRRAEGTRACSRSTEHTKAPQCVPHRRDEHRGCHQPRWRSAGTPQLRCLPGLKESGCERIRCARFGQRSLAHSYLLGLYVKLYTIKTALVEQPQSQCFVQQRHCQQRQGLEATSTETTNGDRKATSSLGAPESCALSSLLFHPLLL